MSFNLIIQNIEKTRKLMKKKKKNMFSYKFV